MLDWHFAIYNKPNAMNRSLLFVTAPLLFSRQLFAADMYPGDVQRFIERREACDHFRGEEPYDAERQAFLLKKIDDFCTGSDKQLAQLKAEYRGNRKVLRKLNEYEPRIELQGQ